MRIKRIFLVLFNSFVFLFKIIPSIFKKAKEGRAKVIIRFDDYGVWCNSDWVTIEEEILKLHDKYGIKISFGVVPDSKYPLIAHPLSPSVYPEEYENLESNPYPLIKGCKRVEVLKECVKKGVAEVALHGFTHPKGYSNSLNSEFYGLPYDLQYFKIRSGQKQLEELFESNVSTFIPPHNTYDYLTLDLLSEFNFKCVSGCYIGPYSPRCNDLNLSYLWYTFNDIASLKQEIVKKIHFKYEPINVIMLHHTNFTTNGKLDEKKLVEYEDFLRCLKSKDIENYMFSKVPDSEVAIFDAFYYEGKDNKLMRVLKNRWPAVTSNYIENKIRKNEHFQR